MNRILITDSAFLNDSGCDRHDIKGLKQNVQWIIYIK